MKKFRIYDETNDFEDYMDKYEFIGSLKWNLSQAVESDEMDCLEALNILESAFKFILCDEKSLYDNTQAVWYKRVNTFDYIIDVVGC